MNSRLQDTLVKHIQSDWQSNPALSTLVNDYTKYHTVLVIIGGAVLLTSLFVTLRLWKLFNTAPRIGRFTWPFEKKVFFALGSVLTVFSLFLGLVWVANLSTALHPLPGFTSLASSTSVPSDSTGGKALIDWVDSGDATFPPVLKDQVQQRIHWQRPKAIFCGLLLIMFGLSSLRIWSYLVRQSRINGSAWTLKQRMLMVVGSATFVLCLLFAIMAIANAQGAIGPIAISLLGAGN